MAKDWEMPIGKPVLPCETRRAILGHFFYFFFFFSSLLGLPYRLQILMETHFCLSIIPNSIGPAPWTEELTHNGLLYDYFIKYMLKAIDLFPKSVSV